MSELLVIPGSAATDEKHVRVLVCASELGPNHALNMSREGDCWLAETHKSNAPLRGDRMYSDSRWRIVFSGDVVDHDSVPFDLIIKALETDQSENLAGLNGVFVFVAYDIRENRLYAVTDRLGQKPLYLWRGNDQFIISTRLAWCARIMERPEFERQWLWQTLFFNYPVDDITFLKGVKRVPAATVVGLETGSMKISTASYARQFQPREPLLKGKEALRFARDIFSRRVPAYYDGAEQIACALTGGWDGRTMLALAPVEANVTAYTYGCPGCNDLVAAAKVASAVNTRHLTIEFDTSFIEDLDRHMLESVYRSSGLLGVLRSTLHYMYDMLTQGGQRFPLTISGIHLDGLFRGHGMVPDINSYAVSALFEGKRPGPPDRNWQEIIGTDVDEFSSYISGRLQSLKDRFGPFENSAHHLAFSDYVISPSHMAGEISIADLFTTVRVPSWDSEIVGLAYSIEQSTLSYSQFLPGYQRGSRAEMVLQSYVLRELAPVFYKLPVGNTRPAAVLAGEIPYQLERAYRGVKRRIEARSLKRVKRPLEDWTTWLFDDRPEITEELLRSSDTLITEYVRRSFVDMAIASRNMYMLGKILNAEIILRLIKNRWQRFW